MTPALIWLLAQTPVQQAQDKTAAEEGADIVLSMLVVGLVIVGIVLLGDFLRWYSHR